MFRKAMLSFLLVLAGHFLFAQDTIYKVNHDKVIAKVLEVNPETVKFRLFSSPDGPLYIVEKSDILKIVYADGHVETFDAEESSSTRGHKNDMSAIKYPFMVSVNAMDLPFGLLTLNGEYYFRPSCLSMKMMVSTSLVQHSGFWQGSDLYYYGGRKTFSCGIQALFYPGCQQRTASYFIGPSVEAGTTQRYSSSYIGAGMVNGVLVRLSDRFNIGMDAVIGIEHGNDSYGYYFDFLRPLMRLEINMGLRFGK